MAAGCGAMLPPLRQIVGQFFDSGGVPCARCGKQVDLWESASKLMQLDFPITLTAAGASETFIQFQLSVGEVKQIELTEFGVPANATVLAIGYTPQGSGCFPLEFHGNIPTRQIIGTKVILVGMKVGEGEGPVRVAAFVLWIGSDERTDAWNFLVEALQAVALRRFGQAIIPAHMAVETALMPLVAEALEQHVSKTVVSNFMDDLKYSHALNVVLPLLCKLSGAAQLPENIRGSLNRLRGLRNNLIHEGRIDDNIRLQDASLPLVAEPLCASVFAFEYIRHIKTKLLLVNGR